MKDALRSIKDSLSRSIFYWLTFVLTSMFMFLFFNLSYSNTVGVTFINAKNNASLLITVEVIAVCMIVIFFGNDFFVLKKSKELAVRLVCGATFSKLTFYILFQTLILLASAIPVGILLAIFLLPVIENLSEIIISQTITLSILKEAVYSTALITLIEILFCTVLNVGYVYRSSIYSLMNIKGKQPVKFKFPLQFFSFKTKQILEVLMYILPVLVMYMNYKNQEGILVLGVIGMIGLYGGMNDVMIPFITYIMHQHINNSMLVVIGGMIRDLIKVLRSNIILLIVSDVLSVSIMTGCHNAIEMMVCLISFVVINILLMMAIMFKFSGEIVGRKQNYIILSQIGFTLKQQTHILKCEVLGLYAIIFLLCIYYLLNILIILTIQKMITVSLMVELIVCFIVPFVITTAGTYIYYKKESLRK